MYLMNTTNGHDAVVAEATQPPPFGPGITADLSRAVRMETWGTSFNDPGDDFTEFRVFDANNQRITTGRVSGY